tara:strand:+ start:12291 stop:12734 length:444 start_codon:yes stop_codon:yes gene_type:complete
MNNIFNNLQPREKNLIFITILLIFIFLVFFLLNNIIKDLNFSNKKLYKAKSDYEYVISKASVLERSQISSLSGINQIKSVIESHPSTQVSDVKIEEIEDTIKLTFRTESLKSSIVLSDDLSMKVNKALTNVTYSNIDNQQVTTLLFK